MKEIKFLFLFFLISLAQAQVSWEEIKQHKGEDSTYPKVDEPEIVEPEIVEPKESMPDKIDEPEVEAPNESLPGVSDD